jgi:aerobic-type carbon monoxide dehydrogenase small subunit (CoxS/CutS family)
MDGALCRCMSYYRIQAAIKRVARANKPAGETR